MRTYQNFKPHPTLYEYKCKKIGEGLDKPLDTTRSHFTNVIDFVEVINLLN